jgi:hypothetical protein
LPLYDNDGQRFGVAEFDRVRDELAKKFGGVTAHRRSPAEGLWKEGSEVSRDDVVTYEVMVETLDRRWWADCREALERRFRQEKIIARAIEFQEL